MYKPALNLLYEYGPHCHRQPCEKTLMPQVKYGDIGNEINRALGHFCAHKG